MQRVLRCDGLLPAVMGEDGKVRMNSASPDEIRQMKAYIDTQRTLTTPFDIVVEGETPGDQGEEATAKVRSYLEAGATWWLEGRWNEPDQGRVLERIRQGPPG